MNAVPAPAAPAYPVNAEVGCASLPLLAPLRHARLSRECPLTGVDRKSPWSSQTDAIDPQRTSAPLAELC